MNHICKCGRIVEHRAHNMCGKCWTMEYSTQYINGEHVPYVEMFKQSKGAKLPDETREEWFARCEKLVRKTGFAPTISKIKGEIPTKTSEGSDQGDVQPT